MEAAGIDPIQAVSLPLADHTNKSRQIIVIRTCQP